MATMTLSRTATRVVSLLAVLAVALGGVWLVSRRGHVTRVTAHLTGAVGVYPGSDVRVLGVKVGTVTAVTPQGRTVRVELSYDADRKVPAGARAVVVAPSLVSDRYVQLTPVYRGGPVLADGADIPVERTASPVELDAIYRSLDNLAVALGPQGANRDGALSRLLDVGAENLNGNGARINQGIGDLDRAVSTLSANRDTAFDTVRDLQRFVSTLANSDQQVRQFTANLASVSEQLADERAALAAALKNLAVALGQVRTFVHDNQALVRSNLSGLAQVADTLVRQRDALAEFLDVAPTALSNLSNAYNPRSGTLDTRNNFNQLGDPAYLCALLMSLPGSPAVSPVVARCRQAAALSGTFARSLDAMLRGLGLPALPGGTPPAAEPGRDGGPGSAVGSAAPVGPGQPATSDLPTIPGVTGTPGLGGLPGLPDLDDSDGVVPQELTDALADLLGGGGR